VAGVPSRMVSPDFGFPELHKFRVINDDSVVLERGLIVYVKGSSAAGDDAPLTVSRASGTATTNAIAVQGFLLVMLTRARVGEEGLAGLYAVCEADTTGFSAGDPLFLKDGATGEFSDAAGSASDRLVGFVLRANQVLLAPAALRGV